MSHRGPEPPPGAAVGSLTLSAPLSAAAVLVWALQAAGGGPAALPPPLQAVGCEGEQPPPAPCHKIYAGFCPILLLLALLHRL